MEALSEAKRFAEYLDGDGHPEYYERNAYRTMALALVAIAESLEALHEIAQYTKANERRIEAEREADLPF